MTTWKRGFPPHILGARHSVHRLLGLLLVAVVPLLVAYDLSSIEKHSVLHVRCITILCPWRNSFDRNFEIATLYLQTQTAPQYCLFRKEFPFLIECTDLPTQ